MSKQPSKQFGKKISISLSSFSAPFLSGKEWNNGAGRDENVPNAIMNTNAPAPQPARPTSHRRRVEASSASSAAVDDVPEAVLTERDVNRKRVIEGEAHPVQKLRLVVCCVKSHHSHS